jgi:hypothetical protein
MSGSPPPSDGVMEISNLMDKDKAAEFAAAAAAAAAASASAYEHQMSHQVPHAAPIDQANSPHNSEGSYHSTQRPYGSPSTLQGQLPLPEPLPPGMMIPSLPPVGQGMPMAPQPPAKNFSCSTCHKRFARRSDLARHGKCFAYGMHFCTLPCSTANPSADSLVRANSQRYPSPRLRL